MPWQSQRSLTPKEPVGPREGEVTAISLALLLTTTRPLHGLPILIKVGTGQTTWPEIVVLNVVLE